LASTFSAFFAGPSLRLAITTRAPWRAKARAVAKPMPLLPPVTSATLSRMLG
jgi:hypothetical protein